MTWSPEFERLVVAAAQRGDLLDKVPLDPEVFRGSARGPKPPVQRIAEAVVKYHAQYGSRPTWDVMTELLRVEAATLGPEERAALAEEAVAVQEVVVPGDARYVADRVREEVEVRALERGLNQARDLLAAGPAALPAVRELLARAAVPLEVDGARSVSYLADADARIAAWRRGDEYGERISTGFPDLDAVLEGGPTRKETWYFLAPPKGLKTASLLLVARAASRRRLGVYLATFEMQALRMALRLDRGFAGATKQELNADLTRLVKSIEGLRLSAAGEIFIDERPPQRPGSVDEAARRVEQLRREGYPIDVVVLDYLNIMGASRTEREKRHELSRVSRDISAFAKALDVLVWTAALTNRAAVSKRTVRKNDIAEVYEAVAVADGMVAICGTKEMVQAGYRRLYVMAAREEADEVSGGDYAVDPARMAITPAGEGEVDGLLDREGQKEPGGGGDNP